jgi:probable HAF family extracellular repeat protein
MRDLGTLPGGTRAAAYGLNDRGEVVGEAGTAAGTQHPFVTGPGGHGMRDLGTWGGPSGIARAINRRGQVVGEAMTASARTLAFITGPDGVGMHRLADPDDRDTSLVAINDIGQAVGHDAAPGQPDRAIVSVPGRFAVVPLDRLVTLPPGVSLVDAEGINDNGQIVASGSNAHVYLLSPRPLPTP